MRVVHLLKGHEDFVGASNIHVIQSLEYLFQNCENEYQKKAVGLFVVLQQKAVGLRWVAT
jgi:hypothetical protein